MCRTTRCNFFLHVLLAANMLQTKASVSRNLEPALREAAPVEVAVSALFPKLLF